MLLDCLGYPINVGDTVVHRVTDLLGVVTNRVLEVEGTNTVPIQYVDVLFGERTFDRVRSTRLVSIYPMTSKSNNPREGSIVMFEYLDRNLELSAVLGEVLSLSSGNVVVTTPFSPVSRDLDEILVMDDRIQYLKDYYPELLL